jgi:hypothetical protein
MLGGREQRQLARRRNAQQVETEDRPQRTLARRQRRTSTGSVTTAPRRSESRFSSPVRSASCPRRPASRRVRFSESS